MSTAESTPPFVQWAISVRCSLRDELRDWKDPDQVGRQLRSLQAIAKAGRELRSFEGICVECRSVDVDPMNMETTGFRIDEVLEGYGVGSDSIPCLDCSANLVDQAQPLRRLAECSGWLICDEKLCQAMNVPPAEANDLFPATRPAWYQLWLSRDLTCQQRKFQHSLFTSICETVVDVDESAHDYRRALERADRHDLPMRVELCPGGFVRNDRWITPPHCSRCRAAARSSDQKRCGVCGYQSRPVPERRRHVRGARPYWALRRFLGRDETRQFLARYRASADKEKT